MPEGLVQTILPPDLLEWVRGEAANSGLSVAAWLRRLVMQDKHSAVVPAWFRLPIDRRKEDLHLLWSSRKPPTFLLQRQQVLADGSVEYRAYGSDGKPFTEAHLAGHGYDPLREKVRDGWVVLQGSLVPHEIVESFSDLGAGGQMMFRLRPESGATAPSTP